MPLGSLETEMIQSFQHTRMRPVAGLPVRGVGVWYNPVSWVIRSSDGRSLSVLQAEGQELDAKLAAFNESQRAQRGEAWFQAADTNRRMGVIDVNDQVTTAFIAGAGEGLANTKKALNDFTGGAVSFAFGSINWKLWLVGAAVAFFWLGGHDAARRYVGRLG